MTRKEFTKIKYSFQKRITRRNVRSLFYQATNTSLDLKMCVRIPYDNDGSIRREVVFILNDREYKAIDDLLVNINKALRNPMTLDEKTALNCQRQTDKVDFLTTEEEKDMYFSSLYFATLWGFSVR